MRDNLPPLQRANVEETHRSNGVICCGTCSIRLGCIREDCLCLLIELLHETLDAGDTLGNTGVDTVQVISPEEDGVQVLASFLLVIQLICVAQLQVDGR